MLCLHRCEWLIFRFIDPYVVVWTRTTLAKRIARKLSARNAKKASKKCFVSKKKKTVYINWNNKLSVIFLYPHIFLCVCCCTPASTFADDRNINFCSLFWNVSNISCFFLLWTKLWLEIKNDYKNTCFFSNFFFF